MKSAEEPSAADAGQAAALDLKHLSAQTLGDVDLQAELLALFAHQAHAIMASLDASFGGPRASAAGAAPRFGAADELHTLCGSARAVGAWQVAEQAADMERTLRRQSGGPAADGSDGLAVLGRSVAEVCAVIDDLSHRPAGEDRFRPAGEASPGRVTPLAIAEENG